MIEVGDTVLFNGMNFPLDSECQTELMRRALSDVLEVLFSLLRQMIAIFDGANARSWNIRRAMTSTETSNERAASKTREQRTWSFQSPKPFVAPKNRRTAMPGARRTPAMWLQHASSVASP